MGLNSSQAKIYLSLVSLGVASAKQIVQTAKIDRGEVYRQMESLQDRTIVEKILRVPIEYRPLPLNETVQILIQQKNKENAELHQRAEELLKKTRSAHELKGPNPKISIIPHDFPLEQYIRKVYLKARREIVWYTQIERVPLALTYYRDEWEKASARGVVYRTIAELNKPSEEAYRFILDFQKQNPNFAVRFADPTHLVTFAVRDEDELDFFMDAATGLTGSNALYTNNLGLVKVIKEFFELKWNSSMKENPIKR